MSTSLTPYSSSIGFFLKYRKWHCATDNHLQRELHRSAQELETADEELQSTHEELETTNEEEVELESVNRRGRSIRCRVSCTPLIVDGRKKLLSELEVYILYSLWQTGILE